MNFKGFSLVELMVVVTMMAILSAIAYPSYIQYVIIGNRTDVKSELVRIAEQFNQYKAVNKNYTGLTLAAANASNVYPKTGTAYYSLTILSSSNTWVVTATPIASTLQKNDGVVCIDDETQKFWSKGATACALSETSTWD